MTVAEQGVHALFDALRESIRAFRSKRRGLKHKNGNLTQSAEIERLDAQDTEVPQEVFLSTSPLTALRLPLSENDAGRRIAVPFCKTQSGSNQGRISSCTVATTTWTWRDAARKYHASVDISWTWWVEQIAAAAP